MEAAAGGPGDMRASHADRERVIDTVKAAFARGQLTAGELDARVGQALTARTYAELAAVTLSIPARSDLARPAKPVPAQPRRPRNRLVNRGACVIAATTLAAGVWVGIVAGAAAAVIVAMFMLNLAALATRPLRRSRPGPSRGRASWNAMKPRDPARSDAVKTRFQPPNQTGLDHISFGVAERTDLDAWAAWLDELGIEHSGVIDTDNPMPYSVIVFRDPDNIQLELCYIAS